MSKREKYKAACLLAEQQNHIDVVFVKLYLN